MKLSMENEKSFDFQKYRQLLAKSKASLDHETQLCYQILINSFNQDLFIENMSILLNQDLSNCLQSGDFCYLFVSFLMDALNIFSEPQIRDIILSLIYKCCNTNSTFSQQLKPYIEHVISIIISAMTTSKIQTLDLSLIYLLSTFINQSLINKEFISHEFLTFLFQLFSISPQHELLSIQLIYRIIINYLNDEIYLEFYFQILEQLCHFDRFLNKKTYSYCGKIFSWYFTFKYNRLSANLEQLDERFLNFFSESHFLYVFIDSFCEASNRSNHGCQVCILKVFEYLPQDLQSFIMQKITPEMLLSFVTNLQNDQIFIRNSFFLLSHYLDCKNIDTLNLFSNPELIHYFFESIYDMPIKIKIALFQCLCSAVSNDIIGNISAFFLEEHFIQVFGSLVTDLDDFRFSSYLDSLIYLHAFTKRNGIEEIFIQQCKEFNLEEAFLIWADDHPEKETLCKQISDVIFSLNSIGT